METSPRRLSRHWLYWSPMNSDRANEIVDHLTPRERVRAVGYGFSAGALIALPGIALIFGGNVLMNQYNLGLPVLIPAVVVYGIALVFCARMIQRAQRKFLKNTAYSKAQGWDQEPLPLKKWHEPGDS